MIVFLLVAVLAVLCFGVAFYVCDKPRYDDEIFSLFAIVGILAVVALLIMIIFIIADTTTAPANNMELLEVQKALEFKLENADIRDEFGLLNKSFVDDVEKYNRKIVRYKANSESPWISIFYPKRAIEGCERIDYEKFSVK